MTTNANVSARLGCDVRDENSAGVKMYNYIFQNVLHIQEFEYLSISVSTTDLKEYIIHFCLGSAEL